MVLITHLLSCFLEPTNGLLTALTWGQSCGPNINICLVSTEIHIPSSVSNPKILSSPQPRNSSRSSLKPKYTSPARVAKSNSNSRATEAAPPWAPELVPPWRLPILYKPVLRGLQGAHPLCWLYVAWGCAFREGEVMSDLCSVCVWCVGGFFVVFFQYVLMDFHKI